MTKQKNLESMVVYTRAPWENALVKLRITGPAEQAGIDVINGKEGGYYRPELVTNADIVVIQRDFPRNWKTYEHILNLARANKKPVIYEIDDLLFDMPSDHSHRQEYIPALLPMLDAVLRADVVIGSTHLLSEYVRQWNSNTWIIPNYLNDRVWKFKQKDENQANNDPLVIGYMGGETHLLDLQFISEALIKVLNKYSGSVRMKIWGGKPPEELLEPSYCDWVPINQLNYASFANFFIQQDCDIFIAPLRDNLFNRSKSELKFLEYSVLGIPGVYSQLPPYESIVNPGQNGYLASTLSDWEECLVKLIERPELRVQMGLKAQNTVKHGWLLSQHYQEWREVYQRALNTENENEQADLGLSELSSVIHQSIQYNIKLDESVNASTEQVKEILESRSWKVIERLQQIRLSLLPSGGLGERVFYSIFGKKSPDQLN